jgi:hypothetical protein
MEEPFLAAVGTFLEDGGAASQLLFLAAFRENPEVVWNSDGLFSWVFGLASATTNPRVAVAVVNFTKTAQRVFPPTVFAGRLPPPAHFSLLVGFLERFTDTETQCVVLKAIAKAAEVLRGSAPAQFCGALVSALPDFPFRVARLACRVIMLYADPAGMADVRVPIALAPYAGDEVIGGGVLAFWAAVLRGPLRAEERVAVAEAIAGPVAEVAALDGDRAELAVALLAEIARDTE